MVPSDGYDQGGKGMKKKMIIIDAVIVITVIIAAAIRTYLLTRPKELGNMNHKYTEQMTSASDISFTGEAGDRIKFSFRSDIMSGDLEIALCDSTGSEVYRLDRAKALETYFTLESSDTYTLTAKCNSFVGTYKIRVYKVE